MDTVFLIIIIVLSIAVLIGVIACCMKYCNSDPNPSSNKSLKDVPPPVIPRDLKSVGNINEPQQEELEGYVDSKEFSEQSIRFDPISTLPIYHQGELPYEARPDLLISEEDKHRFGESRMMDMLHDPDRAFDPHSSDVRLLGEPPSAPRSWKPRLRVLPPVNSLAATTIPDSMVLGPINRSQPISTRELQTVTRGRGDVYWKPPLHAGSTSHIYLPTQLRSRFHHLGDLPKNNEETKQWVRPNSNLGRQETTFRAPDLAIQREEQRLLEEEEAEAKVEQRYYDYLRRHPEIAEQEGFFGEEEEEEVYW